MNKRTLLLFIPLLLSFQKDNLSKTVMFYDDHLETLNGKVKQLIIQNLDLRGTPFLMNHYDTIYFNRKEEEIEERSGWSDGLHSTIKFDFKYTKEGKELEFLARLGNGRTIHKYDKIGHRIGSYYYDTDGIYQKILYRYDTLGNINQTEAYNKSNILQHKVTYRYDDKRLLMEEDYFALNAKTYTSNVLYEYKSFDENGNWIKALKKVVQKYTLSIDTITRKITYY
ncbi:MAG TPA: hypothetical protein VL442_19445 [Mucilaginibacter sp.]|jgi:hypothetical protein|nr:hypothetical protein [Mucilaginibacter sp.]